MFLDIVFRWLWNLKGSVIFWVFCTFIWFVIIFTSSLSTHILLNICAFSEVPNIATSLTETVHLCTSFDTRYFSLMVTLVYRDSYSGFLEIDSEKQEWCEARCATKKVFKNLKICKNWLLNMFLLKLTFTSYSPLYHLKLIVCILGFIYLLTIFLSVKVYFEQLMLISQFLSGFILYLISFW